MRIHAPFTEEQVEGLNRWQRSTTVHPFTCAHREGHPMDPEGDYGVLVAKPEGWTCRHCDYTQDWAWDFMVLKPIEENLLKQFMSGSYE